MRSRSPNYHLYTGVRPQNGLLPEYSFVLTYFDLYYFNTILVPQGVDLVTIPVMDLLATICVRFGRHESTSFHRTRLQPQRGAK